MSKRGRLRPHVFGKFQTGLRNRSYKTQQISAVPHLPSPPSTFLRRCNPALKRYHRFNALPTVLFKFLDVSDLSYCVHLSSCTILSCITTIVITVAIAVAVGFAIIATSITITMLRMCSVCTQRQLYAKMIVFFHTAAFGYMRAPETNLEERCQRSQKHADLP